MMCEAYAIAAAQANGLALTPAQLPGVVANLKRLEAVAQILEDTPLGPDDEAAPVWMP